MRPGWAARQIENSRRDIAGWPLWMRREAGIPQDQLNTAYMREAANALLREADAIDAARQRRRKP